MDGMQGMFGQDPALIQQAIQQQRQQEYNAAANTPQGRGIVSLAAQGGGMLGDALGAATGVKDPRIAEAQLGQQVQQKVVEQAKMQGIDPVADPESFIKLVAQGWMDAGKPDKAYAAVNTLQQMQAQKSKMGLESAKTQAELRKANAEADPASKLVQTGKITPKDYQRYKTGEISFGDINLISEDKTQVVETANGVGLYNKQTGDLIKNLGGSPPKNTAVVNMPEIKAIGQIQGVREGFLKEISPYKDKIDKIDNAIDIANSAGTNALAAKVLPNTLADIWGGSQKAVSEINRLATLGTISARVAQRVKAWVAGTATDVQIGEILPILNAAKSINTGKIKQKESQYRRRTDISKEDMDFITATDYETPAVKPKEPMPSRLNLGGVMYDVTPSNIVSTIANSNMTREEKLQFARLVKENGWSK